jgi:hypothetical protein
VIADSALCKTAERRNKLSHTQKPCSGGSEERDTGPVTPIEARARRIGNKRRRRGVKREEVNLFFSFLNLNIDLILELELKSEFTGFT